MRKNDDIEVANSADKAEKPMVYSITIEYAPELQGVNIVFDNSQYKTWELMLGVLEMARLRVTQLRDISLAQQAQAAALHQMQQAALAEQQQRAIHGILRG